MTESTTDVHNKIPLIMIDLLIDTFEDQGLDIRALYLEKVNAKCKQFSESENHQMLGYYLNENTDLIATNLSK